MQLLMLEQRVVLLLVDSYPLYFHKGAHMQVEWEASS